MVQLIFFSVASFIVTLTLFFVSRERNRGKRAKKFYRKALMSYREEDYLSCIKSLKSGLLIPNSNFLNQVEASLNLKCVELTELVFLNLGLDVEELTLPLYRSLSKVNGIDIFNKNELLNILSLYQEILKNPEIEQSVINHITNCHLTVHRNTDEHQFVLQQEAV